MPFWPFKMDDDMHLIGINFEEAKNLTNALCTGFETAAKKFVQELYACFENPNAQNVSNVAK